MKVSPNPHYTLTALYGKILRALAKMPQDASYRKYTEQIVNDRLKAVQTVSLAHCSIDVCSWLIHFQNKDVKGLEVAIANGQAEELILQAEKELILARKMLGWKGWEPLVKQAPAIQWQWPPAERKQIS
jgi:NADH dehydrogenase (ubiquinone) 1 alpha subcomplex subunit 5